MEYIYGIWRNFQRKLRKTRTVNYLIYQYIIGQ